MMNEDYDNDKRFCCCEEHYCHDDKDCCEDCCCDEGCCCDDEFYLIPEEEFLFTCMDEFNESVAERGEELYENGHVLSCAKSGDDEYIAKVLGSNGDVYDVNVTNTGDGIEYFCDCPYEGSCKHAYAVLEAISNKEYDVVELKEDICYQCTDLKKTLELIPAEELKNYLLSVDGLANVDFDMDSFEEHFRKYIPKQSFEYYYNNLYNALVLNDCYECMVDDYISEVKRYIADSEFAEAFKIVKSIVEAYNDSGKLNNDEGFIELCPELGMYLRVVARKADEKLKESISIWFLKLKMCLYYDNYYLEDIVLSVGEI